jgi:hypothetical protein
MLMAMSCATKHVTCPIVFITWEVIGVKHVFIVKKKIWSIIAKFLLL